MQDTKQDSFFEEENQGKAEQQELMAMIDRRPEPKQVDLRVGARVKGTVNRIGDEMVYVDLDGKSSAVMKRAELTNPEGEVGVKEGDELDAYIASIEGDTITLTKSMTTGGATRKEELRAAMEEKTPVQGKVTGINKGGLQVRVMGTVGFCPASQVELRYVDDLNVYLGRSMSFVITRVEGKRVVLSRVPILEQEASEGLDRLEADAEAKRVRTGTISRIADFGLFVDTGSGIDGLVHISEVSWSRAENLKDNFQVGQQISYVVLGIERKEPLRSSKVSLSLKQAQEDPWHTVASKYPVGSQVEGTVTRCAPFGAFVELEPGVEGLVHLSELSWDQKVRRAEDVVQPGTSVRVSILGVDEAARKISCSIKDVEADPWQEVPKRFTVGSTVTGTVVSRQKYGFFVELDQGITGLLAIPNIAPDKRNAIKVGEEIEVGVGSVDVERRRISLTYGVESEEAETAAAAEYMEKNKPAGGGKPTSEFGEALKAALERKK